MALRDGERRGAAVERAGELLLRVELRLGAQGARQGDDLLDDGDFLLGFGVGELGAVLRVWGERDGFGIAFLAVEALPELFGEEGHGGVEQAQGGFEGGERSCAGSVPGTFFSSMYQSQNSCQKNCQSSWANSW